MWVDSDFLDNIVIPILKKDFIVCINRVGNAEGRKVEVDRERLFDL